MAGAIAELARKSIKSDFRSIAPGSTRIILVEAGPRLLPAFPESLSAEGQRVLEAMHVEVRLNVPVTGITAQNATLGSSAAGQEIVETRTVIWAAGVRASPVGEWLKTPTDRAGRVAVQSDFSVPGFADVFVVGDAAAFRGADGSLVPGLAPAAKQAGGYVADVISRRVAGRAAPKSFAYANYGNLATIGRSNALADFGFLRLSGFFGWILWSAAHIYFLIGFRNRLFVAAGWAWSYLTYQRSARLITGTDMPGDAKPGKPA
jgi:NADH dehydrogenase